MREESKFSFFVHFVVRAVLGMGAIYLVNQCLLRCGITMKIGWNGISLLTSGILGLPGVVMLYGILFYKMI